MPDQIIMKYCPQCKQIKPISQFCKHRGMRDGLDGWCKSCHIAAVKAYQQTEAGKKTQCRANRKYYQTPKGKEKHYQYNQSEKGKYPEKKKARNAITHAIVANQLTPPKTFKCHYCTEQAQQYHHWHGYTPEHWFDVVPACRKCDRKQHQQKKMKLK